MAVTKSLVLFIVLAITYNQGAARSVDSGTFITKNGLASSEGFDLDSDSVITFLIPTVIKKGLIITINGSINPNVTTFAVELPSISGKDSCEIKFDFVNDKEISIKPAVKGYEKAEYDLNVTPGSVVGPKFSLTLIARVDTENNDLFGMRFNANNDGESSQLICKIDSFEDINKIVIKEGVANVDSLLFEFE